MMESDAVFSPCNHYRYELRRQWNTLVDKPRLITWILLNPSTADETVNDPTMIRCINFSKAWGFDGMLVGNIFAFRATDPKRMRRQSDPIGPENDKHLVEMTNRGETLVCGWGQHGSFMDRARDVLRLVEAARTPMCLGVTLAGAPRHPLYIKASAQLEPLSRSPATT